MKVHRTDLVSFVFGLLFVGLALWWLLAQILGLALPAVGWFLAGALVLIGLLGLVGAVRSARTPDREAPPADVPATNGPATGVPAGPAAGDDQRIGGQDTAELHLGTPEAAEPDDVGAEPPQPSR